MIISPSSLKHYGTLDPPGLVLDENYIIRVK